MVIELSGVQFGLKTTCDYKIEWGKPTKVTSMISDQICTTRSSVALYTITKNRFCHLRPPAWLRQTLHSTPRLCMGNIRFRHENCS